MSSQIDISKLDYSMDPRELNRFGYCVACNDCRIITDLRKLCSDCSGVKQEIKVYVCTLHGYINCGGKECQPYYEII